MDANVPSPKAPLSRTVWLLAAAKLLLHLLTANRYGLFRDEMYGLACARHLAWGYVDHPPAGIAFAWLAVHLFGQSPLGLRLLPALAGAALVVLTGALTRELGGRAFAQALAGLSVCVAPMYLIFGHWLMMNSFEPLIWTGCALCVCRAATTGGGRYWLGFGALAGLGFETKYDILFLVVGVLAGLLLTPLRRWLAGWHIWAGVLLCAAIALPNFLWQYSHGFPFLEYRHNIASGDRDIVRAPFAFLADQALIMEPLTAPLWIGGAIWLLTGARRARYGVLGWAFLVVLGTVIALKGKNYYVTPVYPIVFAAGAAGFEQLTERASRKWLRPAYAALVAVTGLALLPGSAPVLAPETYIRYQRILDRPLVVFEHQNNGSLPQYFADEFGWDEMVREVARIYGTLTPEERKHTAIYSNDWGEAAAIDYYGPRYGLPSAISAHDSYWLWGPGNATGEIMIVLKGNGAGEKRHFASVEKAGHTQHPYSRRDTWFNIYLCRGLNFNLTQTWPKMKKFD